MRKPELILASGSSARRQILAGAGVTFRVQIAGLDEETQKQQLLANLVRPAEVAVALAAAKAVNVSASSEGLIIGADQTLELDGRMFSKAANRIELREQLCQLRGKRHTLYSAVALASSGQIVWQDVSQAHLTMRDFSDRFLDDYLDQQGEHLLHCVGGYQLESAGVQLFDQIDGDYFTILGLPLMGLLRALRQYGIVMP
jgi:septum formation protein